MGNPCCDDVHALLRGPTFQGKCPEANCRTSVEHPRQATEHLHEDMSDGFLRATKGPKLDVALLVGTPSPLRIGTRPGAPLASRLKGFTRPSRGSSGISLTSAVVSTTLVPSALGRAWPAFLCRSLRPWKASVDIRRRFAAAGCLERLSIVHSAWSGCSRLGFGRQAVQFGAQAHVASPELVWPRMPRPAQGPAHVLLRSEDDCALFRQDPSLEHPCPQNCLIESKSVSRATTKPRRVLPESLRDASTLETTTTVGVLLWNGSAQPRWQGLRPPARPTTRVKQKKAHMRSCSEACQIKVQHLRSTTHSCALHAACWHESPLARAATRLAGAFALP